MAVTVLVGLNPLQGQAAPPDEPGRPAARLAPGRILVKFRFGLDPNTGRALAGAAAASPAPAIDALRVHRFQVPPGRELEHVAKFRANPFVEYAEPDYLVGVSVVPDDPGVRDNSEWHLNKVEAPAAWDVTTGNDNPVTVAVVDTGIDATHPDLRGRVVAGYNFVSRRPITAGEQSDDHYHGTHVAGILGATGNNGIGGAGLTWSASLMPVKILGPDGYGTHSDLAEGMIWAANHGARIINLSLGDPGPSEQDIQTLKAAIKYVQDKGVLVVAAAGNEASSGNPIEYPAAIDGVLAVGATDSYDQRAYFSNYHPYVGVAAPGVNISSTVPSGDYRALTGTSMATPIVSGIAALILSANPSFTAGQVKDRLQTTAIDLGAPGRDDHFGFGRVSAARALLTNALTVDQSRVTIVAGDRVAGTASVAVTRRVPGTISWQARSGDAWLTVLGAGSPRALTSGRLSDQLVLTADPSKLPARPVKGTVQVGALLGDELLSPQTIEVEVTLPRVLLPFIGRVSARAAP
ncbi:MAG TPA: S8 family serine peptidase [Dehalococcoidia bacterium]|nr:S8 family serine peptidase [Dehalococcoidia bacterium]